MHLRPVRPIIIPRYWLISRDARSKIRRRLSQRTGCEQQSRWRIHLQVSVRISQITRCNRQTDSDNAGCPRPRRRLFIPSPSPHLRLERPRQTGGLGDGESMFTMTMDGPIRHSAPVAAGSGDRHCRRPCGTFPASPCVEWSRSIRVWGRRCRQTERPRRMGCVCIFCVAARRAGRWSYCNGGVVGLYVQL